MLIGQNENFILTDSHISDSGKGGKFNLKFMIEYFFLFGNTGNKKNQDNEFDAIEHVSGSNQQVHQEFQWFLFLAQEGKVQVKILSILTLTLPFYYQ